MAKHKNKGSIERRKPRDDGSAPTVLATQSIQQFTGPIPPPQILQKYDDIVAGGANRIFDEWEAESKHRREIEKGVLGLQQHEQASAVRLHAIGQILAFLAMLAVLSGGLYIATYDGAGAKIGGSLLGAGSLLGIVRAFLGQKNGKRKKGNNK